MGKHTSGPWKFIEGDIEKRSMSEIVADDVDKFQIGWVLTDWRNMKAREDDLANCRLIAAAPDLLAACEAIVRLARKESHGYAAGFLPLFNAASDAIDKARGERNVEASH